MSDYFVEGVRAAQEGLKLSDNPYLLKAREWDSGFRTTIGMKDEKPHKCKCGDKCKKAQEPEYEEPEEGIKLGKVEKLKEKAQIIKQNPALLGIDVDDPEIHKQVDGEKNPEKVWPAVAWIGSAVVAAISFYFVVQWALQ